MLILVLSNDASGLYQFRGEILSKIQKSYDVICIVPYNGEFTHKIELLGCKCIDVKIERRGTNPLSDFSLLRAYLRHIDELKPDVVLTYTIKPNVYGGIACRKRKVPYISNVTGLGTTIENKGLLSIISLKLYKIGLKKAYRVFFQNKSNLDFFTKYGIVKNNSQLIPGSGVNLDYHYYERYPQDDSQFNFLFVGRVMKDKGIEELLTAAEMLKQEGKQILVDVVGGCDEDYTDILNSYENNNVIKYHGRQSDVHSFYKKAHCVVLPSYHEGMANVLLEAASTGRPVIASDIPGCRETFDDGISGLSCKPKDTESLKNAMEIMYNSTLSKREQMGLAGREKMEREFDRNIIISTYLDTILSVQKKQTFEKEN